MARENDVQLIHDTLLGDDVAFNTLVDKYQKSVHALAWRKIGDFHHAEEITQDTFLRAYKKLSTLKNPNQFSGWLYVIANRLCLNWLRKKKPTIQSLESTPVMELEKSAYTNYLLEKRETEVDEHRHEIVKRLLEKLPESERTVVTLYYLGEMTVIEIGKFLGVSVNTIRSRLHRARKRLQDTQEHLIQEVLGGVPVPASLIENIMRQVADIKITPQPMPKPFIPWLAFGTSVLLIALLFGTSSRYLTRFQKPYSYEAQSEPTIEIVDAPIVFQTDVKPAVRNQFGRVAGTSKTSSTGLQVSEMVSTSDALVSSETADVEAWMPDSALRAAIREELALPTAIPLTKDKLRGLRRLKTGGKGITDIKGLEFAQNLVYLHLGNTGNYITDLAPLATLTSLMDLNLGGNQVTNLSPLRSLTSLIHLNLANNRVSDLSPLENLISLETLDLFDNEIESIVPLSGLKNLNRLILTHNRIGDISPLSGLTNLRTLGIKENPIRNLSPLLGLNLTDIKYDAALEPTERTQPAEARRFGPVLRTAVGGDFEVISGVPSINKKMQKQEREGDNHNGINNITDKEFVTSLREPHIGNNPIVDLPPLVNAMQEEALHLWHVPVNSTNLDRHLLTNPINLEVPSPKENDNSNIRRLVEPKKPNFLYVVNYHIIANSHIKDTSPLAGLKILYQLWIKGNWTKDANPPTGLNLTK